MQAHEVILPKRHGKGRGQFRKEFVEVKSGIPTHRDETAMNGAQLSPIQNRCAGRLQEATIRAEPARA